MSSKLKKIAKHACTGKVKMRKGGTVPDDPIYSGGTLPEFTVLAARPGSKYENTLKALAEAERVTGFPFGNMWYKSTKPIVNKARGNSTYEFDNHQMNIATTEGPKAKKLNAKDVQGFYTLRNKYWEEVQKDPNSKSAQKLRKQYVKLNGYFGPGDIGEILDPISFVAELSHDEQFLQGQDYNSYDTYFKKGDRENDAHSQIEPRLWEAMSKNKNNPGYHGLKIDMRKGGSLLDMKKFASQKLYGGRIATHKDELEKGGPIEPPGVSLKRRPGSKKFSAMSDEELIELAKEYHNTANSYQRELDSLQARSGRKGKTKPTAADNLRYSAIELLFGDSSLKEWDMSQFEKNKKARSALVNPEGYMLPQGTAKESTRVSRLLELAKGGSIHIKPSKKGMIRKGGYESYDLGGFLQNISPLISAIPGAGAPIGAGTSILGQIIGMANQDEQNQPLYQLNQMQNGGPVDPNPYRNLKRRKGPAAFEVVNRPKDTSVARDFEQYGYNDLLKAYLYTNDFIGLPVNQLGKIGDPPYPEMRKHLHQADKLNENLFYLLGLRSAGIKPKEQSFLQKAKSTLFPGMKLGGDFKQYSAPSHASGGQLIDANGNPTMNMPVAEIEKNENSHDGYVYSDTLVNPNTGNTFAKDAKKVANKTKRQDDISKSSRILQLMKLRQSNEMLRQTSQMNEQGVPMAQSGLPFRGVPYRNDEGLSLLPDLSISLSTSPEIFPVYGQLPTRGGVSTSPREYPYNRDMMRESVPQDEFYTVTGDSQLPGNQPSDAATTGLSTLNKVAAGLKGASLAFGAYDALRGSEQEQLQLPDYSKGDQYFRGLEIDLAPALNEINMGATKAVQDTSNQAGGIGARNSRVNAIFSRAGKNAASVQLQQQQANAGIRAQIGSREDMKSQTTANERIRQQIAQSQNDATNRLAGRKFFSDLSQVGTSLNNIQYMNDVMKNQNELGQQSIQYGLAVLANKYPNFKPDPSFLERLKSGTLTDADKPLLDQLVQFASNQ